MKLTAEQIKQALEFCANCECNSEKTEKECVLINMPFCKNYLRKQSLDLINRLEVENRALNRDNDRLLKEIQDAKESERKTAEKLQSKLIDAYKKLKTAKAEAIKEFAQKAVINLAENYTNEYCHWIDDTIDNLVKEMVGDSE